MLEAFFFYCWGFSFVCSPLVEGMLTVCGYRQRLLGCVVWPARKLPAIFPPYTCLDKSIIRFRAYFAFRYCDLLYYGYRFFGQQVRIRSIGLRAYGERPDGEVLQDANLPGHN